MGDKIYAATVSTITLLLSTAAYIGTQLYQLREAVAHGLEAWVWPLGTELAPDVSPILYTGDHYTGPHWLGMGGAGGVVRPDGT